MVFSSLYRCSSLDIIPCLQPIEEKKLAMLMLGEETRAGSLEGAAVSLEGQMEMRERDKQVRAYLKAQKTSMRDVL
jgi:hypothetical protein